MTPANERASEVPVAVFLRGVSTESRLGVVARVAFLGGSMLVGDMGLEWPGVSSALRGRVVGTLVRAGWLECGGSVYSASSSLSVPVAAPRRLLALLDELDGGSVPARVAELESLLREVRVLRLASTRDVLSRLAVGPVEHPRELGLSLDRAWAGWSELHRLGWMADGRLVRGRASSLRTWARWVLGTVEA